MEYQAHFRCFRGCPGSYSLYEVIYTCPHCGGERTIRAWITQSPSIQRILGHWQLSPEVPTFAPARAPPQGELFEPW